MGRLLHAVLLLLHGHHGMAFASAASLKHPLPNAAQMDGCSETCSACCARIRAENDALSLELKRRDRTITELYAILDGNGTPPRALRDEAEGAARSGTVTKGSSEHALGIRSRPAGDAVTPSTTPVVTLPISRATAIQAISAARTAPSQWRLASAASQKRPSGPQPQQPARRRSLPHTDGPVHPFPQI